MYKKDLSWNNQQRLICHKTKPNQTKPGKWIEKSLVKALNSAWLYFLQQYIYKFSFDEVQKMRCWILLMSSNFSNFTLEINTKISKQKVW